MKTKSSAHGAGPLFTRLARAGRLDDIRILAEYVKARSSVANDNAPPSDEMGADSIMEMRPTPNEIIKASEKAEDGTVGLRFDRTGKLTAWRPVGDDDKPIIGKDGVELWLRPVERYRQSKGGRRKTAEDLSVAEDKHAENILSPRGSGSMPTSWVPDTRYPSFGAVFERIKAAYDAILRLGITSKNRNLLRLHGVDGERTLEQCAGANPQATITRGKTVIARGAEFLAGKTDKSGTAAEGSFVGAPDTAEMTMIAAIDANAAAAKVGDVLDMALSGMTAREIAKLKGHNDNKAGEEWAVRAIDRAIEELKKSAA